MKNILIICWLCTGAVLMGQVPLAFNYQAVVRNNKGIPIKDKDISLRISILSDSISGNTVYQEIHHVKTNTFGMVNLKIGNGEDASSELILVDWGKGPLFLMLEIDENAGSAFKQIGINQMAAVPYALFAMNAASDTSTNHHHNLTIDDKYLKIEHGDSVLLPIYWEKQNDNFYLLDGNIILGTEQQQVPVQIIAQYPYVQFNDIDGGNFWQVGVWGTNNSFNINEMINGEAKSRFIIQEGGNVGIGTTNPKTPLHIYSEFPYVQFEHEWGGNDWQVGVWGSNNCFNINELLDTVETSRFVIKQGGNIGVGTPSPKSKLQVTDGDVFIQDINKGIIMKSPNGKCWRVTVDDSGSLVNSEITCPDK